MFNCHYYWPSLCLMLCGAWCFFGILQWCQSSYHETSSSLLATLLILVLYSMDAASSGMNPWMNCSKIMLTCKVCHCKKKYVSDPSQNRCYKLSMNMEHPIIPLCSSMLHSPRLAVVALVPPFGDVIINFCFSKQLMILQSCQEKWRLPMPSYK